jgi:2-polyprenyl-3-methyl-5-hydroxy-6-metoxy-1,4-benzoquinol methylase
MSEAVALSLEHPDGSIEIRELANGRRHILIAPRSDEYFISVSECETAYPVDLIERILHVKTPAWLCDEILRDESPHYVQHMLRRLILSHVAEDKIGGRILDFGCGGGASTMILARMFPDAEVVGVDIDDQALSIAQARLDYYGYENVHLRVAGPADGVSEDLGQFDCLVLWAVYEHLLPHERESLVPQLWALLSPGGLLFIGETPHRYSPVDLHTTGLPLINYLPDALALRAARAFSPRVGTDDSWETLLRRGIRGGSRSEIVALIRQRAREEPMVVAPSCPGVRDAFDLWYLLSKPTRPRRIVRSLLRGLHAATGVIFTPQLALALRKAEPASSLSVPGG